MSKPDDSRREAEHKAGEHAATLRILHLCIKELGYKDPISKVASLVAEREAAVAKLREVCAEFGDNEWTDDTRLADIIDKHLARYLEAGND